MSHIKEHGSFLFVCTFLINVQLHFFITVCMTTVSHSHVNQNYRHLVCWQCVGRQLCFKISLYWLSTWGHISVVLKSLPRECVRVKHVFFHLTVLSCKGLYAKGFSDWEGGAFFYGPESAELYENDTGPLVLWLPAEISCLFITGENLFCWFIGWLFCNGWRNSIFALFIRFIFPPLVEEESLVWYRRENFLPCRQCPLWNEITKRKGNKR